MTAEKYLEMAIAAPLHKIIAEHPICRDFFMNLRLTNIDFNLPLMQALDNIAEDDISEFGLDKGMILREFCQFLETFGKVASDDAAIRSLTIIGGHGKSGEAEIEQWTASVGEIISIVGPTGAGKSRLLADIECLADGDTPTGRRIHIDGKEISDERRFDMEGKLVAQLSQNMNFVMDLTVKEFLGMHASSRLTRDAENTIVKCFECANELAGEKFLLDTKVTQLSGGQSRALMIADTAYMSSSPVVLIDEIENAGIDRRQAIQILAQKEKIVFISTHDPLLALSADKRIVIKNGGISRIIETSAEEKGCLGAIEKLDATLYRLRTCLRHGQEISMDTVKGEEQQ
ncbi:MAG: ABC transporter [Candidatus Riflebacteria bacterium HGW-Riflebacteria-1]|jgi:ABC-type lipoprotein export system ATPase subunit|nr:MAG: ABC transporter [Candidatus Riflebacteria bacterium HGW-Riflebacteria-1]